MSGFNIGTKVRAVILAQLLLAVVATDSHLFAQSRALRPIRVAERRALLIGNAEYMHTRPLVNTIADVRELDAALKALGFRTVRKENLTIEEMDEAVSAFASQLRAEDLAFFYFSGHGVQLDSRNYLLPVDFRQGAATSVRRRAIDADSVRNALEESARVRVLVLDACRNNPFGQGKGDVIGLAKMNVKAEGTLVAYATGESNVASDNPGGRLGLYMTHLVDELRRETVELGDVFDRTQQRVYSASRSTQDPEIYDKVIGKLFLRGDPGREPEMIVPAVELPPEPTLSVAEAWAELEGTESEEDLQQFISAYDGQKGGANTWVALAKERLRLLPEIFAEREAQQFEEEWQSALEAVKRSGSAVAAGAFVNDYGSSPRAMVALAEAYRLGQGLARQIDESAKLYRLAADQGSLVGMTKLGQIYASGDGAEKDYGVAVAWYRRAAEQGYAPGQALLGRMLEEGRGGEQSYSAAAEWYHRAAEQGHAMGQASLGWLYMTGDGLKQDFVEALELCRTAADQGSAVGQTCLGRMYERGLGVDRTLDAAVDWYRKAADQGSASGQTFLGLMYENGYGVDRDFGQALDWYRKAADQNNALGQTCLGRMYERGLGVERDNEQALDWYRRAADQGDVEGLYRLGELHYRGVGTPRDYGAAMERFREAADHGYAEALYRLGDVYWNGHGVAKSRSQARKWYGEAVTAYRDAAGRGDAAAQRKLGSIYDEGHGVKKNPRTATSWFRRVADQGFPDAQWLMGERYFSGTGVRKDRIAAMKWYRLAAEQDFADAQFSLGTIYRNGAGVKKNRREAANWYRAAAGQGHSAAKQALRKMGESE